MALMPIFGTFCFLSNLPASHSSADRLLEEEGLVWRRQNESAPFLEVVGVVDLFAMFGISQRLDDSKASLHRPVTFDRELGSCLHLLLC